MLTPYIYPYKTGSSSARLLSEALNCRRIKIQNSNYSPKEDHLVINWGNSNLPNWDGDDYFMLNHPEYIASACDKQAAFVIMDNYGVHVPDYADSLEEAREWFVDNPNVVVVQRSTTNGHGGQGITIVTNVNNLVEAPLYTKYIKKSAEYRVHVFVDHAIDVVQKKLRSDLPDDFVVNHQIRNHDNGWVFCRDNIEYNEQVVEQAVLAVQALNLDFGAVDVIWNNHYQTAYVLEVNSAPGIEGTTVEKYVEAIRDYL